MKKNDIEKLVGILEEFDLDSIAEAYEQMENGKEISRIFSDDEEKVSELKPDGDTVFNLEDMPSVEKIIGENNLLPIYFLEVGAMKASPVAKVVLSSGGSATGFLISPTILLTNNHVFGSANSAKNAKIQFNYQKQSNGTNAIVDVYTTDPDSLFYTNASLDFSIVRVAKHCNFSNVLLPRYAKTEECLDEYTPNPLDPVYPNFPIIDKPHINPDLGFRPPLKWKWKCTSAGSKWGYIRLNSNPSYAVTQFVNIVQHPQGRRKEVALQKNKISSIHPTEIFYKTDTDYGSSGSPVFNNSWELVALHHARSLNQPVNKGIRIDKIVQDLRSNYTGTPTGQQILTELGI